MWPFKSRASGRRTRAPAGAATLLAPPSPLEDDPLKRPERESDDGPSAPPAPSAEAVTLPHAPLSGSPPVAVSPPRRPSVRLAEKAAATAPPIAPSPAARPKSVVAASPQAADAANAPGARIARSTAVVTADIRIPFARVADQLPPNVFLGPRESLGPSLREPNALVIPAHVVAEQLGEGAVEVEWAVIESQFPALASALPEVELRARFVGWRLALPMDDVVRQLASDEIGRAHV